MDNLEILNSYRLQDKIRFDRLFILEQLNRFVLMFDCKRKSHFAQLALDHLPTIGAY